MKKWTLGVGAAEQLHLWLSQAPTQKPLHPHRLPTGSPGWEMLSCLPPWCPPVGLTFLLKVHTCLTAQHKVNPHTFSHRGPWVVRAFCVSTAFSFQSLCVQRVEATSTDLGSDCPTESAWSGRQWRARRGAPRHSHARGWLLCPEH